MGLAGEAGEVANKVKKIYRDKNGELGADDRAALASELGDVLWYIAIMAYEIDFNLDTIAQQNIKKLHSRMERGTIKGSGDQR